MFNFKFCFRFKPQSTIRFAALVSSLTLALVSSDNLYAQNNQKMADSSTQQIPQSIQPLSMKSYEQSIVEAISTASRPFSGTILLSQLGSALDTFTDGQSTIQPQNNKNEYQYTAGDGVNNDSRFMVGSISKTITATLIMQAVDVGQIALDSPVNRYVTHNYNPQITISQLLSHTAGISQNGQQVLTPGKGFSYSNYGYFLLGEVLAKVNGSRFSKQITQFSQQNKLGMSANIGNIKTVEQQRPGLVASFIEIDAKRVRSTQLDIDEPFLSAGGLQATARDITQFQHLLHQGKLISPASLQAMTTSQVARPHRWSELNYGFGLQVNQQNGIIEYSHSGYIPGFIAMMLYYPQFQLSVVVLENTSWDLGDMNRTFDLHDHIRERVKSQLKLHD